MGKIVLAIVLGQFGRGMALDGELQVGLVHPQAVIFHQDQVGAAIGGGNLDPRRAGIQRILDQFLHRRRGPFHNLARSNAIHSSF